MKGLILLYWGTVFLMYLSQIYYPVEAQLDGHQTGKHHFMLRRADIFMIIVIAWMTPRLQYKMLFRHRRRTVRKGKRLRL